MVQLVRLVVDDAWPGAGRRVRWRGCGSGCPTNAVVRAAPHLLVDAEAKR